jgi:adenylosuccinate synthase
MVHKVLPNGVVAANCKYAMIGPGAVFDINRLFDEMDELDKIGYDHFKVIIHPNSVVLQGAHRKIEQANVVIGSTMQGSGAAMVHKIQRNPDDSPCAMDVLPTHVNHRIRVVSVAEYNGILMQAKSILCEGAQGFSLGINERFYPFCTSRDCTPARFLADMGIPLHYLNQVIGTARTYPIRVGNPEGGYSGGCYEDQDELTWDQIGVPPELTTVTQRERRVFTFSPGQIADALWACDPQVIFLNFCNYVKDEEQMKEMIDCFRGRYLYQGYGPTVKDVVAYGKI